MWLALVLAYPLQLPEDAEPGVWADVADAAGLELEDVQGGPGARIVETSDGWFLQVRDTAGGEHQQRIDPPVDAGARADAVWLAASLIVAPVVPEASDAPEPAPAPVVEPPPAPAPVPDPVVAEAPVPTEPQPVLEEAVPTGSPDWAWTGAVGFASPDQAWLSLDVGRGPMLAGVQWRVPVRPSGVHHQALGPVAGFRLQPGPLAIDGLTGLDLRMWRADGVSDAALIPWLGTRVGLPFPAAGVLVEPRLVGTMDLRPTVLHVGPEARSPALWTLGCQIGVGW